MQKVMQQRAKHKLAASHKCGYGCALVRHAIWHRTVVIFYHPPCQTVERVDKLTVLGITINARLTVTDHVSGLLSSCSSLLYML